MGEPINIEPNPFAYSLTPHGRKHGPHGYESYERYRPWLRDEFTFRCVFCLYREQWLSTQTWDIDHLLPKKKYPEKEREYENLLYLCRRCNGNKSDKLVPDPCRVALGKCIRVYADGEIVGLNRKGRLLINALRLDNYAYTKMREQMVGILRTLAKHDKKRFVSLMCFPNNLPDLASLNPTGNTRREGIENSFFSLKSRNKLPEVY
jgi:HNH endonuclease